MKESVVNCYLVQGKADLPAYLGLFHHHFEKSIPVNVAIAGRPICLNAPIDQLDMLLKDAPGHLASEIDSIEVTYRRQPDAD